MARLAKNLLAAWAITFLLVPLLPAGLSPGSVMTFHSSTIDVLQAQRETAFHLLEPMMAVGPGGALYVAAHSAVPKVVRSPVFASNDDGATWRYLDHVDALPGQEGSIFADNAGHLWMLDDGEDAMPLYRWCDGVPCGLIPNVWDVPAGTCEGLPGPVITDRPWVAAGAGKLVLVNWPGETNDQYAQIGTIADDLTGLPIWNPCALGPGEDATGPPAVRSDGTFVVPHLQPPPAQQVDHITLAKGSDPRFLSSVEAMKIDAETIGNCLPNWGWTGFDATDRLFVAAGTGLSSFSVATSTDLVNFTKATYNVTGILGAVWLSARPERTGAVVSFAVDGSCETPSDFYAVHVRVIDGQLVFENESYVGTTSTLCRDYNGSAIGPDGRTYLVLFDDLAGGCDPLVVSPTHPLKVYIQDGGPTL